MEHTPTSIADLDRLTIHQFACMRRRWPSSGKISNLILSQPKSARAGVSHDQNLSTGSTTVAANKFGTCEARPSRDGIAGAFYGHSRGVLNKSAYSTDTIVSARQLQQRQQTARPAPASWPPNPTAINGNSYAYVEETSRTYSGVMPVTIYPRIHIPLYATACTLYSFTWYRLAKTSQKQITFRRDKKQSVGNFENCRRGRET